MAYDHIEVTPLTPHIGAMVEGVKLAGLEAGAQFAEIEQAMWRHHVLFFRDQPLDDAAHLALARHFGELTEHEFMPQAKGGADIHRIEHEGGYGISPTARWHVDVTFRARPNLVSVLRAIDLPPTGGDTLWCSTGAAFDALPDPLKVMLLALDAEHDLPWLRRLTWSGERETDLEAEIGELRANPQSVHPAVITHPITGRMTLFVNSIWTKKFLGVDLDLSSALLAMLWEWVKKPEFQVRFCWQKDSVAIWDNLGSQHVAVFDYEPHHRAMRRVLAGSAAPSLDPDLVPAHLRPPAPPPKSIIAAKEAAA